MTAHFSPVEKREVCSLKRQFTSQDDKLFFRLKLFFVKFGWVEQRKHCETPKSARLESQKNEIEDKADDDDDFWKHNLRRFN